MWEGPAHCGWGTSGLVVLGSIRKQTEQAMRSKPVSSTLHGLCIDSCFVSSCPDFLQGRTTPQPSSGHSVSSQPSNLSWDSSCAALVCSLLQCQLFLGVMEAQPPECPSAHSGLLQIGKKTLMINNSNSFRIDHLMR